MITYKIAADDVREASSAEFVEDFECVVGIPPSQRTNEDAWTWIIGPLGGLSGRGEVLIQERANVAQVCRDQDIIYLCEGSDRSSSMATGAKI